MIVAIGDSIINGYPHRRGQSFTGILREKYGYDIINKGVNGDTCAGVLERFENDAVSKNPDMIFVHVGTNDFIEGAQPDTVLGEVLKLIDIAGEDKVIVLTPILTAPALAAERWMPADYEMVNMNMEIYAGMVEGAGLAYIDLQYFVADYARGKDIESVYVDGIHPTAEVHEAIAEYLDKALKGEI